MLFTELNTDVLLYIYGCLDPIDSINLAETCRRLRDVAQLHYKRFKIFNLEHFFGNRNFMYQPKKHRDQYNRIGATTVLKHIGPFIDVLTVDLDVNKIGSDVSTPIRKYCVNVKTLNIFERSSAQPLHNPYTAYFDWLKKLNLTQISLTMRELLSIDLSKTTTLEELHIHYCAYRQTFSVDYGRVANILEKNVNLSCLRIPLICDFKYEIFEKLKYLKRLVLDIEYYESLGQLEKVSAHLKITALEKVELNFVTRRGDGLNEFLQKLSENALHLKHLSIVHYAYPLSSLHLLNLASLRWIDEHSNFYEEIPKIQPNLTHLDLMIHDGAALPKPVEQIIYYIENLEKLELLHIRFSNKTNISSTLKDFLQESVLCRIFDCHSINRPTVTLRFLEISTSYRFVQVELDFGARKWTWTTMKRDFFNAFIEHPSNLPFYDSYIETFDDFLAVQRFSGTASDLNSVNDEAIKWFERLSWME